MMNSKPKQEMKPVDSRGDIYLATIFKYKAIVLDCVVVCKIIRIMVDVSPMLLSPLMPLMLHYKLARTSKARLE